ncbi:phage tail protein [Shewanella baltica]|uniref:phage tail protein n=1 Tax=Shewanella baltica TaxID=62322 RepID=UPI00217F166B|nr:tail fiber protein [Shewanella baltica]MCS6136466.1 phage tail protein [Shewanella baltica]MCS6176523.1 phage tail protein [Shewanella baltica]
MDEEYIGVIKLFAGNFAPDNFMFCNGQELQISQYGTLYSIIGNNFGGSLPNTFKLPDMRGRVSLGFGNASSGTTYQLGQADGQETVTLTLAQMPVHNHAATTQPFPADALGISATVNAGTAGTTTNDPTGAYWGKSPESGPVQAQDYTDNKNVTMAADAVQVQLSGTVPATGVNVSDNGGRSAHENRQPFLALNYIICVRGLYPTRP